MAIEETGFVLSDPFCVVFEVCVWIIVRLKDPNMAHYKISNRVSHLLIFYLLVFDSIHDVMYLNKMSRTSSRNISESESALFAKCVQTHKEFVVVFKKLLVHTCMHTYNHTYLT